MLIMLVTGFSLHKKVHCQENMFPTARQEGSCWGCARVLKQYKTALYCNNITDRRSVQIACWWHAYLASSSGRSCRSHHNIALLYSNTVGLHGGKLIKINVAEPELFSSFTLFILSCKNIAPMFPLMLLDCLKFVQRAFQPTKALCSQTKFWTFWPKIGWFTT